MKEKKTMQKPELEFVRFDETDVIATSSPMVGLEKNNVEGYGAFKDLTVGGIGIGITPQ